ncbi:hypothetical protein ABIB73_001820 [Bradyrhizobium sp. F1.4.3]
MQEPSYASLDQARLVSSAALLPPDSRDDLVEAASVKAAPRCQRRFAEREEKPGDETDFRSVVAVRHLARQARPASRLGHPDKSVGWVLACKLPAKCGARTQLELTHHRPSLPEARCTQPGCYAASRARPIALVVIVPKDMSSGLTKPRNVPPGNAAKTQFVDLAQAKPGGNAMNIGCYSMRARARWTVSQASASASQGTRRGKCDGGFDLGNYAHAGRIASTILRPSSIACQTKICGGNGADDAGRAISVLCRWCVARAARRCGCLSFGSTRWTRRTWCLGRHPYPFRSEIAGAGRSRHQPAHDRPDGDREGRAWCSAGHRFPTDASARGICAASTAGCRPNSIASVSEA